MSIERIQGDCLASMAAMSPDLVDAIVTDPPYGLGFMGQSWDTSVPPIELWTEALRVCKPGAHILCFAGTRTVHRMGVALEDAGWEIRDMIAWVYGSGFPKSHDVSKALDRAAGAVRQVMGRAQGARNGNGRNLDYGDFASAGDGTYEVTEAATESARAWQGWGTALKPALEPIILARKPFAGTVAENVLKYGTGGINIDGCRVGTDGGGTHCTHRDKNGKCLGHSDSSYSSPTIHAEDGIATGRWPANLIHDGSEEVTKLFPSSSSSYRPPDAGGTGIVYTVPHPNGGTRGHDDAGSAARFFYSAKATAAERRGSRHPTVKPLALMRYLVRLITPPGGTVLDPFAGTGTTGEAALAEGCRAILIEQSQDYFATQVRRLDGAQLGFAFPTKGDPP